MVPIAITGPTGGVGSSAIDLFKRAGFTVHAITGKAGKADDYLKSLGADQIVSWQSLSVGSKPLESATWGGVVDTLGGATPAMLTRPVHARGNIAIIGIRPWTDTRTMVMLFIRLGIDWKRKGC